jgi:hypothetical protein
MLDRTVFSKVFEGQGTLVNRVPLHAAFLTSMLAQDLLGKLQRSLPRSQAVALTAEVPLSLSLERVIKAAEALQVRLERSRIEPLHLLAATMKEESGEGVKLFQDSGITEENIAGA